MPIFAVPGDMQDRSVLCVICSEDVLSSEVTAGSRYADGRQAFACNKHLNERTNWITAWAAFRLSQTGDQGKAERERA